MRDMYSLYAKRTTSELNQMRSKKYLELQKVANISGYFAQRDVIRLNDQITAIDAELAKRKAQLSLPL